MSRIVSEPSLPQRTTLTPIQKILSLMDDPDMLRWECNQILNHFSSDESASEDEESDSEDPFAKARAVFRQIDKIDFIKPIPLRDSSDCCPSEEEDLPTEDRGSSRFEQDPKKPDSAVFRIKTEDFDQLCNEAFGPIDEEEKTSAEKPVCLLSPNKKVGNRQQNQVGQPYFLPTVSSIPLVTTLIINGQGVDVTVDTGAGGSILSLETLLSLKVPARDAPEETIVFHFTDYQGKIIAQPRRPVQVTVSIGKHSYEVVFHVTNRGNILGLDLIRALNLSVISNKGRFLVVKDAQFFRRTPVEVIDVPSAKIVKAYRPYAYAEEQRLPPGISILHGTADMPDGIYDIDDCDLPHLAVLEGFVLENNQFSVSVRNLTPTSLFVEGQTMIGRIHRAPVLLGDKWDTNRSETTTPACSIDINSVGNKIEETSPVGRQNSSLEDKDPVGQLNSGLEDDDPVGQEPSLEGRFSTIAKEYNPYEVPTDEEAFLEGIELEPGMTYFENVKVEDWEEVMRQNTDIPPDIKEEMIQYFHEKDRSSKLFSKHEYDIGRITFDIKHRIELDTDVPIASKPYRLNPIFSEMLNRHMNFLEQIGHVTVGHSPYAQPAFIIPKKSFKADYGVSEQIIDKAFNLPEVDKRFKQKYGGSNAIRVIYDSRRINSHTVISRFAPVNIQDIYALIGQSGASIFTLLDVATGFGTVPMSEEARIIASVVTDIKQFLINNMCFGLRGAPSTFLEVIAAVLRLFENRDERTGLPFCAAYMDDIIVFSQTPEDHWKHLKVVFEALITAGLKLKVSKVAFFQAEVEFLGRTIDKNGVRITPKHEKAVSMFPTPFDVHSTQRFLGFCVYVSNLIPDFARKAVPLFNLLKKDTPFVWTDECENAFQTIKLNVKQSIMLTNLPPGSDLYIGADASETGSASFAYFVKSFHRDELLTKPPSFIYENQYTMEEYVRDVAPILPTPPKGGPKNFPLTSLADKLFKSMKDPDKKPGVCVELDDALIQRIAKEDKPVYSYLGEKDLVHFIFIVQILSGTFSKSQKNWPILEKECWALLRGIKDVEHLFLTCNNVYVLQDSMGLIWLLATLRTTQTGVGKLHRWFTSIFQSPLYLIVVPCPSRYQAIDALTRPHSIAYKVVRDKKGKLEAFAVISPFKAGTVITFEDLKEFVDETYDKGGELLVEKKLLGNAETPPSQQAPESLSVCKIDTKFQQQQQQAEAESEEVETFKNAAQLMKNHDELVSLLTLSNFLSEQAKDEEVQRLKERLTPAYYVYKDLLHRRAIHSDPMTGLKGRIYVPASLTPAVLAYYHLDAHQGAAGLEAAITVKYFWKGVRLDCQLFTAGCHLCQTCNHDTRGKIKLMPSHIPRVKLYHWAIDVLTITSQLPPVLVAIETYSGFKMALLLPKKPTGAHVAEIIETRIFAVFGAPHVMSSDNGTNLVRSKEMRKLLFEYKVQPALSMPYSPISHGGVERANLAIVVLLRKLIQQTKLPPVRLIPRVMMILNSQPLPSLNGLTPLYVLTGRNLDESRVVRERELQDLPEITSQWDRIQKITQSFVERYRKKYEERKETIKNREMKTPKGSYVYIKNVNNKSRNKAQPVFHSEPLQVVREYPASVYAKDFAGRVKAFHKNNVKPCPERLARLYEKLPFFIKAIIGTEFTYEEFQMLADEKTYPGFYVKFEKERAPEKSVIMTRQQARSFLPRHEDDRIESAEFDMEELESFDSEDSEEKRVTFDL
mgnify:FL=1